ncbi:MAG: VOC family protein [Candidatus Bathyarchaeia archaeon]
MSESKESRAVPSGFRTVTPYLVINGAAKAIEFYKKAFNAKELSRNPLPDGRILNARIKIGDSIVMLSEEFPGSDVKSPTSLGASTVTLHIYSKDAEKLWKQAISAGAKVTRPMENQFWGERYGQLADPFGHHWSISKQVKMSDREMETKRKASFAMFKQDHHPGKTE